MTWPFSYLFQDLTEHAQHGGQRHHDATKYPGSPTPCSETNRNKTQTNNRPTPKSACLEQTQEACWILKQMGKTRALLRVSLNFIILQTPPVALIGLHTNVLLSFKGDCVLDCLRITLCRLRCLSPSQARHSADAVPHRLLYYFRYVGVTGGLF